MSRWQPDAVTLELRAAIGRRLRLLSAMIDGPRAQRRTARSLGVPARSWYGWTSGDGSIVPAEVVCAVIARYDIEPAWLLHGTGPVFREDAELIASARRLLSFASHVVGQVDRPAPTALDEPVAVA